MQNTLRTKKFYFLIFSTLMLMVLSFIRVIDNTSDEILKCVDSSLDESSLNNVNVAELSQTEICESIRKDRNLQATCLYNVRQSSLTGSYKAAIYLVDYQAGVHAENISQTIEAHCNSLNVDE